MKRRLLQILIFIVIGGLIVSGIYWYYNTYRFTKKAHKILEETGIEGGLIVHVGVETGKLTAALHADDSYLFHGISPKKYKVKKARRYIDDQGLYGEVSVKHWNSQDLPYANNLVNLLVAEQPGEISEGEMMRVLAPQGVAYIRKDHGWVKKVKPRPGGIDEWPQYLHGADNNAVAQDSLVGPPRHLQWKGKPKWMRSHMTIPSVVNMISSGGRLFTIEDRATPENPFLPGEWYLIARDAFNGMVLWEQKLGDWEPITRYVKDMADQLQRRLVATNGSVYCTPGLDAPLTEYDASTGEVIKKYSNSLDIQEFAYHRGVFYLVTGDRMNAARYNIFKPEPWRGMHLGGTDSTAPFGGVAWSSAYAPETPDKPDPLCSIVAMEEASGKVLWKKKGISSYIGVSMAIKGSNVVFQTENGFACLNRKTGETKWIVEKKIESQDGTSPNTVILSDEMAYAQEGDSLFAYSLEEGSQEWKAPIANNYESSADLFLAGGKIWTGGQRHPSAKWPTAYDPKTGEQMQQIKQDMTGPMGHDRCYRNFITDRYFINSKTGGADFMTLKEGKEYPNHWTRSTCGHGPLPSNGLLYVGPWSCKCSVGVMVEGFNAYSAEDNLNAPDQEIPVQRDKRLVKGPAYGDISTGNAESGPEDWPTYRHDGSRGGVTNSNVPEELTTLWNADLGTSLSAPIIAKGRVFISQVEQHKVCALKASNGTKIWEYTAGGRVDSPPTYYKGVLLFGSRDGWVHCVRASDGELVWRFKDLPEKMISAHQQLESPWPVNGSILVKDGLAYFAAGRDSFLDGGIFLYALDPMTGKMIHIRRIYGPFDKETGFPSTNHQGFKTDIPVTDGKRIYLRHKGFQPDLSDADTLTPHVIPTAGFTGGTPQHRTYWTVATGYYGGYKTPSGIFKNQWNAPWGDILVTDGEQFFEVRGFPPKRHSYFDPRLKGYLLFAGKVPDELPGREETKKDRKEVGIWQGSIHMNGKAMVKADKTVFLAGNPAYFPPDHPVEKYDKAYEGKLGGRLLAVSASNGKKLAEYKLDAPPAWDGLAVAQGRLYLSLKDGRILCLGGR